MRREDFSHRWTRIHTDKTTPLMAFIRVNPCSSVANLPSGFPVGDA